MQKGRILAVDIDDVIIETSPLLMRYYNKTYGANIGLEDMYSGNLQRWGVSDWTTAISRFEAYLETDEYRSKLPLREAISAIKKLSECVTLYTL